MLHIYRQITGIKKHQNYVITKERKSEEQFPYDALEIQKPPKSNFIRRFWLKYIKKAPPIVYRGEYRTLEQILTKRGCDLMHIYFGHTGVHLLPFIKKFAKPVIVSFHGMDVQPRDNQPGYLSNLKLLLKECPLVLARSNSLADRLIDLECPPEKIRINRTGIPLESYPYKEKQTPDDGNWKIVQACRLIEKKGLDISLKAIHEFQKQYPKTEYHLAGEGPLLENTKQLAESLNINITFHDFLSQQELCNLYHQSHIFIHPSRITADQNQEGIPNSMLEAMSSGLPVVATQHGGIPEAVTHGKNGLLYPENDIEGITEGLLQIANDSFLYRTLSEEASAEVYNNFEQSKQIEKLESFYEEAISLHGAK